jgi:hypothetical protein
VDAAAISVVTVVRKAEDPVEGAAGSVERAGDPVTPVPPTWPVGIGLAMNPCSRLESPGCGVVTDDGDVGCGVQAARASALKPRAVPERKRRTNC